MTTSELLIPEQAAGRRLDLVVQELLGPDFSRAQIQRLLRQGRVTIAGAQARPSQKVKPGQKVAVDIPEPEPVDLVPEPMDLDILFEDEDIIIINKPPGLVVHPAPGHARSTLVHGLLHYCGSLSDVGGKQRPGIVHRLDKDTSGALVAAKTHLAHRGLVAAFAAGHVQKQYLALVWGAPPLRGGSESGIGRHPVDRKRMSSRARNRKPAQSRWRVVRYFKAGVSLLRVDIHTGRTHQIRVHLSEAGFPVVGDSMYGGRRRRKLQELPQPAAKAIKEAGRQLLHAVHLGFRHPLKEMPLNIQAPLPLDFRNVLRACLEYENA
ncbi:MAG: RluA family pseudouridine synthase [Desulfarculaceae bacterium]|jgi:23S rRNA pseudouridine1911/1915/1917 synthase